MPESTETRLYNALRRVCALLVGSSNLDEDTEEALTLSLCDAVGTSDMEGELENFTWETTDLLKEVREDRKRARETARLASETGAK